MQQPRFQPSLISIAVLAAFSLSVVPAAAQTAVPADAPPAATPTTLAPIVVRASADASAGGLKAPYAGGQVARGGRVGILGSQDNMDTPFSITSYTQKLIQDQQAASIAEVLQNDPAVRVARGFGNFQQLYMVRGLPVYSDDMSYNGLYGVLPRQYLAAELIERVEVLRGASAFLNGAAPGSSGLGGAINVMPKRAPNEALNEVTFGVASGGQTYVAADVARRFGAGGNTGIRVNAVRRDGETSVDGEKRELSALSVGADFRGDSFRVSADLGYQDHQLRATQPSVTFSAGVPISAAPDAKTNLAQPWTFSNERDTFGTLRAEFDLGAKSVAWAAIGAREGNESSSLANPTVTATDGTTTSNRFDVAHRDSLVTGEVGARTGFDTGSVKHTLVVSAAAYRDKSKNAYDYYLGALAGNLYSPSAVAAPTTGAFSGGVLADPLVTAETKTSSVAIADTLAFAQDRVLLTLGARHQKIESVSYDYSTGAQTDSYSASRVTPVAGVVFKVSKQVSLYATYVEGLVKGDTATGTPPVTNQGQVFAPYQTKQTELGVKLDSGLFGGSASVFQTRKPVYGVNTATNTFELLDHQRNRGAELSVFGQAMPGLRLLGGASFLSTDVSGKDAIGTPRSQFNLGAEWDLRGVHGLTLEARGVHTASQYADADNTQVVTAWSRLDVGARYTIDLGARQITLRGRIDNLANRNYWASAGGYPGAGYLTLGAPRTFVLSGTLSF